MRNLIIYMNCIRSKHRAGLALLLLALIVLFPLPTFAQISPDIAPGTYFEGEFIVRYQENKTPEIISDQVDLRAQRAETLVGRLQNTQEDVSASLKGEKTPEELQSSLAQLEETYNATRIQQLPTDSQMYIYTFDGVQSPDSIQEIRDAYQEAPIEYIQPNFKYYLSAIPIDTDYPKQWGMKLIKAESGWDIAQGLSSVKVGVVDSGIDKNHPDLIRNVIKSEPIAPGCVNNGDSNGHGTHIAGVIGATANNVQGVAGLNWDVSILGYCVVSPSGIGSSLTIAQGIDKAVADGVDVINISLGGPIQTGQDRSVEEAIDRALAKDITVVAAAGNCGTVPPGYHPERPECLWGGDANKYMPGSHAGVINVAAIGPQNEHPAYSNAGSSITISAPGGNPQGGSATCQISGADCIYSTWDRYKNCPATGALQAYCPVAGTSMAAPHVTGLVALMKGINKGLTPGRIMNMINSTADDLGTNDKDPIFGYGRIDVPEALQRAKATVTSTPTTPTPAPTGLQCPQQKQLGDYDCNGLVNIADFEAWRQDYILGKANLTQFEWFRAGYTEIIF